MALNDGGGEPEPEVGPVTEPAGAPPFDPVAVEPEPDGPEPVVGTLPPATAPLVSPLVVVPFGMLPELPPEVPPFAAPPTGAPPATPPPLSEPLPAADLPPSAPVPLPAVVGAPLARSVASPAGVAGLGENVPFMAAADTTPLIRITTMADANAPWCRIPTSRLLPTERRPSGPGLSPRQIGSTLPGLTAP